MLVGLVGVFVCRGMDGEWSANIFSTHDEKISAGVHPFTRKRIDLTVVNWCGPEIKLKFC